jgi:vitamin B12 transporter
VSPHVIQQRAARRLRRVQSCWLLAALSVRPSVAVADPDEPLYEVVVHGPAGPEPSARDETAASTVLRGEELSAPGESVARVLSRVPGVQVTRSGASSDAASASIRAASAAQTPVMLGGIRLNEEVTGGADLSTVPLWMLDRIEVFRGDAPVYSDQLGIGGAVVLEPELPGRQEARAGAVVGSYGERGVWGGVATGNELSSALIGLRADRANNDYPYVDDGATRFTSREDRVLRRPNADSTSYDLWAMGRHRLGSARATSLINVYDRDQGASGILVVPALHARARTHRQLGALSTRVPCSARENACRLELSTSALLTQTGLSDPMRELGLGTTETHNDAARVVQGVAVAVEPFGSAELSVSVRQSLDSLELERLGFEAIVSHRSSTGGTASLAYRPSAQWTLYGVGRGQCQSTWQTGAPEPCAWFEPSGRLGAKWSSPERLSLFANIGRYVRTATLGELFGISATVLGNPELVPETGVSADLGAQLDTAPKHRRDLAARAQVWLFAREVSDLVAYRRSSLGFLRPFNVDAARVLGLELSAGARWLDAVEATLSLTALDARDVSAGRTEHNDILPLTSRLVMVDALRAYQRFDTGSLGYASVGLTLTNRSSRYADPAGTVTIPRLWNTDLVAVTRWFDERLTLRAAIDNLFDARSFDRVGLPLPGRTWHTSVELRW